MQRSIWEKVKELIHNKTGISFEVLDLLAVNEILLQCVQGLSIAHIAYYVDQDEDYVSNVLEEFLGFSGWSLDLDFSPIVCYNRTNSLVEFLKEVDSFSPLTTKFVAKLSYEICRKYKKLERIIKNDGNTGL